MTGCQHAHLPRRLQLHLRSAGKLEHQPWERIEQRDKSAVPVDKPSHWELAGKPAGAKSEDPPKSAQY